MKWKAILVVLLMLVSGCVVITNSDVSEASSSGSSYEYRNVDSYYYNGIYVRITESIVGNDTGYKSDGTSFEYDLLKTEYHTYPNSDGSWVLSKYYQNNELVYLDSRDYRNNNGSIEADVNGNWVDVATPNDNEDNLKKISIINFIVCAALASSLDVLVAAIVIAVVYNVVEEYIESGKSGSSDTARDKVRSEIITSNNLVVTYINDVPKMVNIGGIEAPIYDFCDETLKQFDAFVYYLVIETPIPDDDGNDIFISPIAFDRSTALEVMRIDVALYNIWSAYSEWAEHLAYDMYVPGVWEFHCAAQDAETFDHYHGKSSTGKISASKAFYGLAWGNIYESDDPDNWRIDGTGGLR